MNKKVRWGVIGAGGIARRRTIPEGILPSHNAELVAVLSNSPETTGEAARQFQARAAASIDDLLSAEIDAIYVATPVDGHLGQVLKCAQSRKHILCEKPLGMTVTEAEEMLTACRRAGVQLGCAFMMRFQSQHQQALRLIQEGKLGQPVYGRAQLSCWYPPLEGSWRQDPARGGGGSLIDMGGHCIDLLEMFFGKAEKVSCFTHRTAHSYTPEDSAVVSLSLPMARWPRWTHSSASLMKGARTPWSYTAHVGAFWPKVRSARPAREKWWFTLSPRRMGMMPGRRGPRRREWQLPPTP